jgi:predicted transposase YdaD
LRDSTGLSSKQYGVTEEERSRAWGREEAEEEEPGEREMRVCGRDTGPSVAQLTTEVVRKVEEVSFKCRVSVEKRHETQLLGKTASRITLSETLKS